MRLMIVTVYACSPAQGFCLEVHGGMRDDGWNLFDLFLHWPVSLVFSVSSASVPSGTAPST